MCPNIRCDRNFRRRGRNQTYPKSNNFIVVGSPKQGEYLARRSCQKDQGLTINFSNLTKEHKDDF